MIRGKNCPLRPARLGAVTEFPYYADILTVLNFHETDKVETLSVDEWMRVYYNRSFWESKTVTQKIALIVHEALHPGMSHAKRGRALNAIPQLWNIACDMEINDGPKLRKMLAGLEGIFPEDANLPPGKIAEYYYNQLLKEQQQPSPQMQSESGDSGESGNNPEDDPSDGESEDSEESDDSGEGQSKGKDTRPGKVAAGNCGSGADGQKREYELPAPEDGGPDGVSAEDLEVIRQQVAMKVTQSEKARGEVPAGLIRIFEEMLKPPKVNWRTQLKQAARDCIGYVRGNEEPSYALPPRRIPLQGSRLVLPAMMSPTPNVGLLFDTSGSMGTDELVRSVSEAEGIFRSLDPTARIRYLACDSKCYGISDVNNIRSLELRGGGGTDMRIGIDEAIAQKEKMDVLVIFTDGYTPWPTKAPKRMKIICCLTGSSVYDKTPSWMKTIHIED